MRQSDAHQRLLAGLAGLLLIGFALLIVWIDRSGDWESGLSVVRQAPQQIFDQPASLPPSWPLAWLDLPAGAQRTNLPEDPARTDGSIDGKGLWIDSPWGYRVWQAVFHCDQDWLAVRAFYDNLCAGQGWQLGDIDIDDVDGVHAMRERTYVSPDGRYLAILSFEDQPATPLSPAWRAFLLRLQDHNAPFHYVREVRPIP